MLNSWFCRCDTARIFTFFHIDQFFGQCQLLFLDRLSVLDDADCDIWIDVTQHIQIHIVLLINLQDVLLPHLAALDVLQDGNGTVELVKFEVVIYLKCLASSNMIQHNTILNLLILFYHSISFLKYYMTYLDIHGLFLLLRMC